MGLTNAEKQAAYRARYAENKKRVAELEAEVEQLKAEVARLKGGAPQVAAATVTNREPASVTNQGDESGISSLEQVRHDIKSILRTSGGVLSAADRDAIRDLFKAAEKHIRQEAGPRPSRWDNSGRDYARWESKTKKAWSRWLDAPAWKKTGVAGVAVTMSEAIAKGFLRKA
jgi:multidrug resistance efflux pump